MIFNIQKCSIHDGEGLRTLVFFKGCPLRCPWCANPESQKYQMEIMESPVRCIGCGACRDVCPEGAVREDLSIDRSRCISCFKCVEVCYAEAKKIAGKEYSIEELYHELEKDKAFYTFHDGGVTFSGGEPLTHGAYLEQIAKKCREGHINVVVESCGYAEYKTFESALPYIDAMFMDIKHIDPARHKAMTGVDNFLILENIKRIAAYGIPITVRTPVVPGYTDNLENIQGIARFIADVPGIKDYELLAYHDFGKSKYKALGRFYELEAVRTPTDETMHALVRSANQILEPAGKLCFWTKNNEKEVIK